MLMDLDSVSANKRLAVEAHFILIHLATSSLNMPWGKPCDEKSLFVPLKCLGAPEK